ncbi:helix-turn-helix domain-containing protein [Aerococcus christensenii]|uniref:helix-turn-helix domain-containing protein n=1 Tax=Aerococcus christensenii TaxID=87541 RepID=UPI003F431AB4
MDRKKIDKEAFGQRIKTLRKSHGLTQTQFAKKIDATLPAVSNWETGRNTPNNKRLKAIADWGGISVDELRFGNKEQFARRVICDFLYNYMNEKKGYKQGREYNFIFKEGTKIIDHLTFWLFSDQGLEYEIDNLSYKEIENFIIKKLCQKSDIGDLVPYDNESLIENYLFQIQCLETELEEIKNDNFKVYENISKSLIEYLESVLNKACKEIESLKNS